MSSTRIGVVLLVLVAACTDAAPLPLESGADVAAADRTEQANARLVAVCHGTGSGRFHPISVASPALPAHLGHGDVPLVGRWAGSWYVRDVPRLGMTVAFREDCAGFEPGAWLAEVDYGGYCSGFWTFDASLDGGWRVIETIVGDPRGCVPELGLDLTYEPETGRLRVDVPGYPAQYGLVTRAD